MSVVDVKAIGTIVGPGSVTLDHGNTLKVGWSLDAGWTWSATIFGSSFDYRHARNAVYTITLIDGFGNTMVLPPMTVRPRTKRDSKSVDSPGTLNLSGVCVASRRLGRKNQSFPSYRNSLSDTIISALATRADVIVNGMPSWPVGEEEIKEETLAEPLDRFLKVAAYDRITNLDGEIDVAPWEGTGAGAYSFPWKNRECSYDDDLIFTGVRAGKRTSRPAAGDQYLPFDHAGSFTQEIDPITGPGASEAPGSLGFLGAIAFFDGHPGNPASGLVAFYAWNLAYSSPVISSSPGPATHVTVICDPLEGSLLEYPVVQRVKISGTPVAEVPEGMDLAFLDPEPTNLESPETEDTSLGAWPSDSEEFIDPIIPSAAWWADRKAYALAKLNSAGDQLHDDGVFHLGPRLDQRETYESRAYKVTEISWDVGGKSTNVTLAKV